MTRLPPFSSLLSPPEPALLSDFNTTSSNRPGTQSFYDKFTMAATKQSQGLQNAMQPISPPISPLVALQNQTEPSQDSHENAVSNDPVLYPEPTRNETQSADQLFPNASIDLLRYRIRQHIARRDAPSKSGDPRHARQASVMPTEEEYVGFVAGAASIMSLHNRNPRSYVRIVQEQNAVDYKLTKGIQALKAPITISEPVTKGQAPARAHKMSRTASGNRVQKPSAPKRGLARRTPHTPAQKARTSTPDEKALVKKKTEDVNFEALPDFSPALSTLDNRRLTQPEWTANPLDLSEDPHRHLLHDSELKLASALRLYCNTYLCSKRRIFEALVEKLRAGKAFRKTDAQQACKIDVNKASKLWTAYDSVGWLDERHFLQHLG